MEGPRYADNARSLFLDSEKTSGLPIKFIAFSGGLLALVFLAWLGMRFGYLKYLENQINGENGLIPQLDALSERIPDQDYEQLATIQSQISNIETLLGSHIRTTEVFNLIEQIITTNTSIRALDYSSITGNIEIDGVTSSYSELATQVKVLEESESVEKVTFETAELDEGNLSFRIQMKLMEDVYR